MRTSVNRLCKPHRLLFFLLLFAMSTFAQTDLPPLGKVEVAELLQKKCPLDSLAGAMYLINEQETEIAPMVGYNYKTIQRQRVRIKIYNRQGFPYASIKIIVPGRKQMELSNLLGFVYKLDDHGKIVTSKIEEEDIYKNQAKKGTSTISFAFPNVTEGCIVEYTYTATQKDAMFIPSWNFQGEIPTALAYCKISTPEVVVLQHRINSNLNVAVTDDKKIYDFKLPVVHRTFTVKNIPAFKPEPLMGALRDNQQQVDFAFLPSRAFSQYSSGAKWGYLNALYTYVVALELNDGLPSSDSLIIAAKKISLQSEKMKYLSRWVKRNIKWNKEQTFFPDDIKESWEKREGNSAELNLILMYLLRKADVKCFELLFSTRGHGQVDTAFASLGQFNGVDVVAVDSLKTYLLDATQTNLSPFVTPANILNSSAFVVNGEKGQWVHIDDNRIYSKQYIFATARIDSTGQVSGNAKMEYFDYAKEDRLKEIADAKIKDRPSSNPEDIQINFEHYDFNKPEDESGPLTETFDFNFQSEAFGNHIILNPAFLATFKKNPFASSTRNFDIDLGTNQTLQVSLNLQLAPNFSVEDLPKNITMMKSDSTIYLKRISDKDQNMVRSIIRIQYNESRFSKEEYPDLKEFFTKMFEILNQPIVLKKER